MDLFLKSLLLFFSYSIRNFKKEDMLEELVFLSLFFFFNLNLSSFRFMY